jgi:hypothetical protein
MKKLAQVKSDPWAKFKTTKTNPKLYENHKKYWFFFFHQLKKKTNVSCTHNPLQFL